MTPYRFLRGPLDGLAVCVTCRAVVAASRCKRHARRHAERGDEPRLWSCNPSEVLTDIELGEAS